MMQRRDFLKLAGTAALATALPREMFGALPDATATKLPRWRGFNLLEKFQSQSRKPFLEEDFAIIAEWGFDFVRLPISYLTFAEWKGADFHFDEKALREIDQAVEWGRQHGVHVNINLHRIPGYCVSPPAEPFSLWKDPQALVAAQSVWGNLAQRYRGVASSQVSFNLLNEPPALDEAVYFGIVRDLSEAIRKADPARLILADGLKYGNQPMPSLAKLGVAQSAHCYEPFHLTHYKAGWAQGSDTWPVPTWPIARGLNNYLYGDGKREFASPLVLRGDFKSGGELGILVKTVSVSSKLVVRANGSVVFEKQFTPGSGEGEWKSAKQDEKWKSWRADYGKVYTAKIPVGTGEIAIENTKGDWMTFSELRVKPFAGAASGDLVLPADDNTWGKRQETIEIDAHGNIAGEKRNLWDRDRLKNEWVAPWKNLAASGVGVHIGEWGAHNKTPHAVVLAWMRDCLELWREAGSGWALWSLRGSFGVLDSSREDVRYEDFRGHKLDREMLDLLKRG